MASDSSKAEKKHPERYHHGNLKPALIRMGLEILVSEGTESLSLREVARRVGVSHAAPYRHFADKNALIVSIAEEGFTLLNQELEETSRRTGGLKAPERFRELGLAYISFAKRYKQYMKVMFGSFIADYKVFPDLEKKVLGGMVLLEQTLQAGQAEGSIAARDQRVMAFSCWSMVHGVSMLVAESRSEIARMDEVQLRDFSGLMIDNLIAGLRP